MPLQHMHARLRRQKELERFVWRLSVVGCVATLLVTCFVADRSDAKGIKLQQGAHHLKKKEQEKFERCQNEAVGSDARCTKDRFPDHAISRSYWNDNGR